MKGNREAVRKSSRLKEKSNVVPATESVVKGDENIKKVKI